MSYRRCNGDEKEMTNSRLLRLYCFAVIFVPLISLAQSSVTHSAGLGDNLPSQACKACPGSEWHDAKKIMFPDGLVILTGLNEALFKLKRDGNIGTYRTGSGKSIQIMRTRYFKYFSLDNLSNHNWLLTTVTENPE